MNRSVLRVTVAVVTGCLILGGAASATAAPTPGKVVGHVFGDRNDNGVFDAGEGLSGLHIQVLGNQFVAGAVTKDDGTYTVDNIPPGEYSVHYTSHELPKGWQSTTRSVRVVIDETGNTATVNYRGVRPLRDILNADVTLDKMSYRTGDTARVRVALTNFGSKPAVGVRPGCNRGDSASHVANIRWGELGTGVTLRPRERRVFEVTGTVPAGTEGRTVFVMCDFGPTPDYPDGYPEDDDFSAVALN